jgi:hypothetical protein
MFKAGAFMIAETDLRTSTDHIFPVESLGTYFYGTALRYQNSFRDLAGE